MRFFAKRLGGFAQAVVRFFCERLASGVGFEITFLGEGNAMRMGAVSYLNTKPLIDYWQAGPGDSLRLDLPSRLADDLKSGDLDLALIPSVEVFQNSELVIVPDACISCWGEVWSVKLMSRVPMASIRSLALDEGSRTSAVLCQILLSHLLGVRPQKEKLLIHDSWTAVDTDAVLVIGDRAMAAQHEDFPFEWDLGEVWNRWSGLPFVFAVWATRRAILDDQAADLSRVQMALNRARDQGQERTKELATRHAATYGLSETACRKYLGEYLHFRCGVEQRKSLNYFYRLAAELNFAPSPRELIYHEC